MNAEHVETLREILLSYGDQPNHFTLEKAAITAAIAALSAVSDAVRDALERVVSDVDSNDYNGELSVATYDAVKAALAANKPAGENE